MQTLSLVWQEESDHIWHVKKSHVAEHQVCVNIGLVAFCTIMAISRQKEGRSRVNTKYHSGVGCEPFPPLIFKSTWGGLVRTADFLTLLQKDDVFFLNNPKPYNPDNVITGHSSDEAADIHPLNRSKSDLECEKRRNGKSCCHSTDAS